MRCLAKLLLDRAAALHAVRPLGKIFAEGARDAFVIDGAVLIEAMVLRRHDSETHRLRNFFRLQDDAILDEDAAKFLAVDVIKSGGDVEIVELLQVIRLGARVVDQRLFVGDVAEHASGDDPDNEADDENGPELPPNGALFLRPCRSTRSA